MNILENCEEKCAIALGNFDGLHRAHMEIINRCIEFAKKKNILSGILLFDIHTSEVFGIRTELLTTLDEKKEILEKTDLDFIHIMHFDKKLAGVEPEEFIERIREKFNVEAFFAGYDYTFGKGAKGNAELLKKLGDKYGFSVHITDCVKNDEKIISSSAIRELVEAGDMKRAQELLGRSYFVSGKVEKGFGNGTKLLFPTANISVGKDKLLPPDGVYCAVLTIDGKKYMSAANIGKNPTFGAKRRTLECFILDFSGEIYGKHITAEFKEKIRDDIKFDNAADLKLQIEKDIEKVRNYKE